MNETKQKRLCIRLCYTAMLYGYAIRLCYTAMYVVYVTFENLLFVNLQKSLKRFYCWRLLKHEIPERKEKDEIVQVKTP